MDGQLANFKSRHSFINYCIWMKEKHATLNTCALFLAFNFPKTLILGSKTSSKMQLVKAVTRCQVFFREKHEIFNSLRVEFVN